MVDFDDFDLGTAQATNTEDYFADFGSDDNDDAEVTMPTPDTTGLTGTLIKITSPDGLLESLNAMTVYINHGLVDVLEEQKNFLVNSELCQYMSEEAQGAYSTGLIEDAKREVNASYIIVKGEEPTQEEIKSAELFNRRFKQYIYKSN